MAGRACVLGGVPLPSSSSNGQGAKGRIQPVRVVPIVPQAVAEHMLLSFQTLPSQPRGLGSQIGSDRVAVSSTIHSRFILYIYISLNQQGCIDHSALSPNTTKKEKNGITLVPLNPLWTFCIYIYIPRAHLTSVLIGKKSYFGWLVIQNRGHSGSRYVIYYMILYDRSSPDGSHGLRTHSHMLCFAASRSTGSSAGQQCNKWRTAIVANVVALACYEIMRAAPMAIKTWPRSQNRVWQGTCDRWCKKELS